MIDGWSDDSYKKYLGVIVCFVPNLFRLNDIPHEQILDLTKNNRGELQCKMFLSLKPIKDVSESALNLMEWVIEVLDFYETRNNVIGIMSDKAATNVKMTALLYQELKTNSTLIKKTGDVFYLNCTAHLENRLITKISKGLKKMDKGWQKRIIKFVRLLHNNSSLKYKWLKVFGFMLPNQNETRWFSEFRVYHLFLRSAPRLGRFLKDNKKSIFEKDRDLFTYSTDELNEISLLLYLMAPLNELFFQLQKDNLNSAFFSLYYFKLIMKYLNDIEIITSGGRLKGDLGMSLKCFERFQNVEALSNTEHDLIRIFSGAKKLFMKEYYDQQFFTIHLVMDALNLYSKTSFTQKMQKPEDFNKSFDRLFNFFHSYLGSTISSNRIETCLVNFNNSSCSERVKSLHAAMKAINVGESNEFIRCMLERKIHEVPETIQEMGEGIYEFWISI